MAKLKKPERISFMVGEKELEALREVSRRTMIPVSALLRRGIEMILERYRAPVTGRD